MTSSDVRRAGAEFGIELAGFFPAQRVERFDEFANAVDLGAEQAKLDDLFIAEVLGKIDIDLIFVDGVLALLNTIEHYPMREAGTLFVAHKKTGGRCKRRPPE